MMIFRFATLLVSGLVAALLLPAVGQAQELADYDYENLEFRGFGFETSYLYPAQIRPTLEIGIRADLGYLGPHVRIVPRLNFWSSFLEEREVERLADQIHRICVRQEHPNCPRLDLGEIRRSNLSLTLDGHYVWHEEAVFTPYAGGSFGLHFLNGRGEFIDDTFIEDLLTNIAPGVSVVGGVELELVDALRLFSEARATAATDVRYLGLTVGGTWFFPTPRPGPWRPAGDAGRR